MDATFVYAVEDVNFLANRVMPVSAQQKLDVARDAVPNRAQEFFTDVLVAFGWYDALRLFYTRAYPDHSRNVVSRLMWHAGCDLGDRALLEWVVAPRPYMFVPPTCLLLTSLERLLKRGKRIPGQSFRYFTSEMCTDAIEFIAQCLSHRFAPSGEYPYPIPEFDAREWRRRGVPAEEIARVQRALINVGCICLPVKQAKQRK